MMRLCVLLLLAACGTGTSSRNLGCIPITCGTGGACGNTTDGCGKALACADCVDGKADLAVEWSSVPAWAFNTNVSYALTIVNNGPASSNGAHVAYAPPSPLTITWSCVGSGGAVCPAETGSGGLADAELTNFPGGGKVVFTFQAHVGGVVGTDASSTATVSAGFYPDPTPANNSAVLAGSVTANPNAPTISTLSGATTARQGATGLSVSVNGAHLDTVTGASAGPLSLTLGTKTATSLQLTLGVPHGLPLDSQTHTALFDLTLASPNGDGVKPSAITVTAITVSVSGVDAANGTLNDPFRTVTHGLAIAQANDTLFVRTGTYNAMETWPVFPSGAPIVPSLAVVGEAGTILQGPAKAAGSTAFIVDADATLSDMEIFDFDVGLAVRGGVVALRNLQVHDNGGLGLDAQDADVSITETGGGSSRFDSNGTGTGINSCGGGSLSIGNGVQIINNLRGISDLATGCSGATTTRSISVGAVQLSNLFWGVQLTLGSGSVSFNGAVINNGTKYGFDAGAQFLGSASFVGGSFSGNTIGGITYKGKGALSIDGTSFDYNSSPGGSPGNAANVNYNGPLGFTALNIPLARAASGDINFYVSGSTGATTPSGPVVTLHNNTLEVQSGSVECAGAAAIRLTGTIDRADLSNNTFVWHGAAANSCTAINNTTTSAAHTNICGTSFNLNGPIYTPIAGEYGLATETHSSYSLWTAPTGTMSCP